MGHLAEGEAFGDSSSAAGGLYDPATDSWQATADAGDVAPRGGHTAVWTGSEMIVWGGIDVSGAGTYLAGGGRYLP